MKKARGIIIAAAGLFLFMAAQACVGNASLNAGRPASSALPGIKKDCSSCHTPEGSLRGGELKKALSQLCLDCHRDRTAPAEHRVDIVPKMEVKGLPLFDGRITCTTCHDPHKNTHGSLLRMPARKLCFACHPV